MKVRISGGQSSKSERMVEFQLSAHQAKSVNVCGTFNGWRTHASRLTKDAQGLWTGWIQLKPGRYEYRFYVDGQWVDDPSAQQTVANPFGSRNAVLEVR